MTSYLLGLAVFVVLAVVSNAAFTVYVLRKNRRSTQSADLAEQEARAERLLTEIHRVTSANVELLEERIETLRQVGGLADERLKRIRTTLTELEVLLNRVSRIKRTMPETGGSSLSELSEGPSPQISESSSPATMPIPQSLAASRESLSASRTRTAELLVRQGLTEREIAEKMGMGIAEIRFLLKLAGVPAKAAVESR